MFKHWSKRLFSPGTFLRENYTSFRQLLEEDKRSHELLAELEEIYYSRKQVDIKAVESRYAELSGSVSAMIDSLLKMTPGAYTSLRDYFTRIDAYIRFIFDAPVKNPPPPYTITLSSLQIEKRTLAGNKAFNLALLHNHLDLSVPRGFVITTNAFTSFLEHNNLQPGIDRCLALLDISSAKSLHQLAGKMVSLVNTAEIPPHIEKEIMASFTALEEESGTTARVAVRSSAAHEDSETSFAGQYATELNIGKKHLLEAVKKVYASKYSPKALYYRIHNGLSDAQTPMAVLVVEMLDAAVSGVIYTADPAGISTGTLTIHSLWGLGEPLVSGEISPDILTVAKNGPHDIIHRQHGDKFTEMVRDGRGKGLQRTVPEDRRRVLSLDDDGARELAVIAMEMESFFGEPQDIEWCMDSDGRFFILQTRPLKIELPGKHASPAPDSDITAPVLFHGGECASSGAAAGTVFVVENEHQPDQVPPGAILVARNTLPGYAKMIDRIHAVIADRGSMAGHFSSVAREYGLPVIVNAGTATEIFKTGQEVTISAADRTVYQGIVAELLRQKTGDRKEPATPFFRKLKYMLDFIATLNLVDPAAPDFTPEGCRSLHDIIRFVHEKSMHAMFATGDKWGSRIEGSRKIVSSVPMTVYALDVGRGLADTARGGREVSLDEIRSLPFQALWRGISNPGIDWSQHTHFDWQSYDNVALAGGVASSSSDALASYAVISDEYLNLNMRFGYHFTMLDSMCGPRDEDNYILVRFAGGGGDYRGKELRLLFLAAILKRLGFSVETRGDLLDAQFLRRDQTSIMEKLDMVGRLLGATRLMDMVLRDREMVDRYVDDFFQGRYMFSAPGS